MSNAVKESITMLEMLPDTEQKLAYEFIKKLVMVWAPDYTKLTPNELKRLETAENGEDINAEGINQDLKSSFSAAKLFQQFVLCNLFLTLDHPLSSRLFS